MTNDDYKHFVCIIAGNEPENLLSPYNINTEVKPYILYSYSDAKKLYEQEIKFCKLLLKTDLSNLERAEIEYKLEDLEDISPDEYFENLANDYQRDENLNIISNKNPFGKWYDAKKGKMFSTPFFLKNGKKQFSAKKNEIDWSIMHLSNQNLYNRIWEMVIDNSSPKDENEKQLFSNMKDYKEYLKKFKTKENYILFNTSFWGYAFLSEETGWVELEDNINQFSWVKNFYKKFIEPLPEDTELHIYECTK